MFGAWLSSTRRKYRENSSSPPNELRFCSVNFDRKILVEVPAKSR